MRASRFVASCSFLWLILALALLIAQPVAAHAQTYNITGAVTGVLSGTAQVTAVNPQYPTVDYTANVNNVTKQYSIPVPSGVYTVAVSSPSSGYTSNPVNYTGIVVAPGYSYNNLDFVMTPIDDDQAYSVKGTVYLSPSACPLPNGAIAPAISVNIQITTTSGTYYANAQVENGQGTYLTTVYGIPTSAAPVSTANYTGVAVQPVSSPPVSYIANLTLQRLTFDICGNLIGYQPSYGNFTIGLSTAALFNAETTGVQKDGTYAFRGLGPGNYLLNMGQTYPGYVVSPAYPAQLNAPILANDSTGNNFTVTAQVGTVSGSFTGLPPNTLQGVSLCIFNGSVAGAKCIQSDTVTGNYPNFLFTNVPPGTYIVKVAAPAAQFNITPTNSVPLNVTAGNNTPAGVFAVTNGGNNVLVGTVTYTGQPTNIGFVYITLTSTTYPGFSLSTQVTVSGLYYQSNVPQNFQFGGPGVNIPPGIYHLQLTSGVVGITPSSSDFYLPPTASGTQKYNLGTFQTSLKGVQVQYAPAAGACTSACSNELKFRSDLIGRVSLPSLLNPGEPGAIKLGPTPAPKLSGKLFLLNPSGSPSSSPKPMTGGGLTPSAGGGEVVPYIHFVNGFGPPDPNNPGYNLPDPNAPSAGLALYVGAIYAPIDGWYWFRSVSGGPLALAVKGFPGQVPLVIDASADIYQTQFGASYLTGGHQYYIAVYYYYDDVNTVQLDISWQAPGETGYSTISDPFYSQGSTLEALQSWFTTRDGFTAAAYPNQVYASEAGYTYVRNEGCAYPYPLPGTTPLYRLWNGVDNFDTATNDGLIWASTKGYQDAGIDSYIFPTPLTDNTSVAFNTYFNPSNGDNYETGTLAGAQTALSNGYMFMRTEGYVLPASNCQ